jgi:outer membrane protein OmpA-like peptidoglycan-associated protein/opacity protein-like surface antigen
MRKTALLSMVFVLPLLLCGQAKKDAKATPAWDAGLFLGYANYSGDLMTSNFTFNNPNFTYGFFIRQDINSHFAWRANLFSGRLSGNDADYPELQMRNTDFSTPLIELGLNGEYAILKKPQAPAAGAPFKLKLIPYLSGGPGLAFINPSTSYGGTPGFRSKELQDREADKPKANLVFPIGAGVKADLSRNIYLGLEFGYRFTLTDYIDGVKFSGNPNNKDAYHMGGLTLGFHLHEKDSDRDGVVDSEDRCPNVKGAAALRGCPDRDNDGVSDRADKCPDLAGIKELDGCPDQDGDGIVDDEDLCPTVAGSTKFGGCPDTDGDGIQDKDDKCPTAAGTVGLQGCPDDDGDGVANDQDPCPNQAGSAALQGCPDQDKDGLADKDDECPTLAGSIQSKGCPDADNDGVEDRVDKCPNTFGLANNSGCPEVKAEDKAILDFAMSNVNFETNSAKLLASSLEVLDKVADVLLRYPEFQIFIEGHTDDIGDAKANQRLSQNRVLACSNYLRNKGIPASSMNIQGFGESKPIADNKTKEGRKQNRRVEFRIEPW